MASEVLSLQKAKNVKGPEQCKSGSASWSIILKDVILLSAIKITYHLRQCLHRMFPYTAEELESYYYSLCNLHRKKANTDGFLNRNKIAQNLPLQNPTTFGKEQAPGEKVIMQSQNWLRKFIIQAN